MYSDILACNSWSMLWKGGTSRYYVAHAYITHASVEGAAGMFYAYDYAADSPSFPQLSASICVSNFSEEPIIL